MVNNAGVGMNPDRLISILRWFQVALEAHQPGGGRRMHETDEKVFDGTIKVNSKGVCKDP